ncbi:hypothetical protein [Stutzerimonas nitrititolerans]|uniref:hypothetical protein n=1 Tax=Stutzerimonas nitrititolerans TaxID=2482751 RepID=UPI00289893C3|nr:hypothetical protein [Stutzerimonas nitrititolerans]
MSDSLGKILLDKLRKILIPDFTNKLTWLLGAGGLALIGGPALFRLVGKVSAEFYGVPIEVEFLSEDRSGTGVFLCILAVVQNIAYQAKGALSEAYAIKKLDRKHEMDMLSAKQAHDVFMKESESEKGLEKSKREHDLEKIKELTDVFPFETSCNSLIAAADTGISDTFQERLETLAGMHHITYKLYDVEAEAARYELIKQAIETQGVLSSNLVTDSRFEDRYVPCFEQKHNGLRVVFYENQEKMRMSCIALIRAYQKLVEVLQEKTLWGVNA